MFSAAAIRHGLMGQVLSTEPSGPGAHRYWRVYAVRCQLLSTGYISTPKIEMREAAGGSDATQDSGVSFTASSGTAANAFDGTTALWSTSTVDNEWIAADFGAGNEKEIKQLAITAHNNSLGRFRMPCYGYVEWSDDNSTWNKAWPFLYPSSPAAGTVYTFDCPSARPGTTAHRYWRWWMGRGNSSDMSCAIIEMRESIGGTDLLADEINATMTASTNQIYLGNATDGNTATSWYSTSGNYQWLRADFDVSGSDRNIKQLRYVTGSSGRYAYACALQHSDDASAWETTSVHLSDCTFTSNEDILYEVPTYTWS